MAIDIDAFRVREGDKVNVTKLPTKVDPFFANDKEYEKLLQENVEKLAGYQERLYAQNTHSVLVVLQAMDTGGKDGLIRHVFSGINPQGCQVTNFGKPSPIELDHDFLWRTSLHLPVRGNIGVFNRSYYEEVLVVKVHPEILESQNLPQEAREHHSVWEHRYRSIMDHERHLHRNGPRVVKFFLHISKEEQRDRLLARIEDPEKHWKFSGADIDEREHWDDYMKAFSECLSATSSKRAPWYVIPGDSKKNARLIASEILVQMLQEIDPGWPEVNEKAMEAIERGRVVLQPPASK